MKDTNIIIEGTFRIDLDMDEITFSKGYANTYNYVCSDVEKELAEVFSDYAKTILLSELRYQKELLKEGEENE